MATLSAMIRATRPLAHGNIAPPILFGQALALAATGRFSWTAFAIAQTFGVLDHLVIVFTNDYADREADAENTTPTPFSGGSRVLPDGEISPSAIRTAAIVSSAALVAFAALTHLLACALAALALIVAYSAAPLRLSYRGGGELLQGLGVGVVLPLVGWIAQGAPLDARLTLWLAPTFVLGVAGNVLTSIPDEDADRGVRKASPAARWGGRRARGVSMMLHALGIGLGWMLLPLGPAATIASVLAILPQVASRTTRSALAFVILGGLTETLAILGWSLALLLR